MLDDQDGDAQLQVEGIIGNLGVEIESRKTMKTKEQQLGNEKGVKEVDGKGKEDEESDSEETAELIAILKERMRLAAGGKSVNYCLDYQWSDDDEEGYRIKYTRKGDRQKKKVSEAGVEDEEEEKGDDKGKNEGIVNEEVAKFRDALMNKLRVRDKRVKYCLEDQWFDEDEEGFIKKKRKRGNKQKKKASEARVGDGEEKEDDNGKKEDTDKENDEEKVEKSKRKGGSNRRDPTAKVDQENGEVKKRKGRSKVPKGGVEFASDKTTKSLFFFSIFSL